MTFAHTRFTSRWRIATLLLSTLLARLATLSAPYYVDGPNHVKAVRDGSLFIQPPGYFLFALSARVVVLVSHLSSANAISLMNVAFSVAGVWIFHKVMAELFPGLTGFLLACCYAASNVVWFAAEIHSTYASMTFFAPLLFYVLVVKNQLRGAWIVWAVLSGFRPSDGVFLLPLMIYASVKRPWRQSVSGVLLALPICALWCIPTVIHFGGTVPETFSAANRQIGQLPSGILVHGFTAKGFNNLLHFLFGTVNAWNVLLPFVVLGLFQKDRIKWFCLAWMLPALLFLALYFVSDSMYFAFLVAPGMVLAALGLGRFSARALAIIASTSVLVASFHMLLLRPIPAHSIPVAVLDSYTLEYTGWALKHQYAKRLSLAIEELRNR